MGAVQHAVGHGVVQPHQQLARFHRVAVLLQHLGHDGGDLVAQVGAALGLDRAGDDGAAPSEPHAAAAAAAVTDLIAGLDPAISSTWGDGRVKPGHDK